MEILRFGPESDKVAVIKTIMSETRLSNGESKRLVDSVLNGSAVTLELTHDRRAEYLSSILAEFGAVVYCNGLLFSSRGSLAGHH